MLRKLIKKTLFSVKILLVFLVAMALLADGVGASVRLISDNCEVEPVDIPLEDSAQLKVGPPSPEEMPGNMVDGGKANTEQSALLQVPVLVKNDNPQQRLKVFTNNKIILNNLSRHIERESIIVTSLNMIDSHLGHRFTLAGSKPSGTM